MHIKKKEKDFILVSINSPDHYPGKWLRTDHNSRLDYLKEYQLEEDNKPWVEFKLSCISTPTLQYGSLVTIQSASTGMFWSTESGIFDARCT